MSRWPIRPHVVSIIAAYQQMGFGTALDDFGAGHAGLACSLAFSRTRSSSIWTSSAASTKACRAA
jgi:hypothetical protein